MCVKYVTKKGKKCGKLMNFFAAYINRVIVQEQAILNKYRKVDYAV